MGSGVWFSRPPEPLPPVPAASPAGPGGPVPHILLVSDNPDAAERLSAALAADGLRVETAADASAGLARLANGFDLLLCEFKDSEAGFKLRRRVKQDKKLRRLPIVVRASDPSHHTVLRGLAAGADRVLGP